MKKSLLLLLLFAISITTQAQFLGKGRYLTPTFSTVSVQKNVEYAVNFSVLETPLTKHTFKKSLKFDVYTPDGDANTKRPVVIYLHTGNFLPQTATMSPSGTLSDSTAVDICMRLAKLGYVAISADYRIGWNPLAATQEDRTNLLINAAYRGLQDVKTCVRYVKANSTVLGIDSTKIAVWGQGTGGYIAMAAASLDNYLKIVTTKYPQGKFIKADGVTPMVIQQLPPNHPQLPNFVINADPEGKLLGKIPPGVVGPPPAGDTLNNPNHVANTSNFQFCVNVGGALGDASWLDKNTPPMISFQAPYDPFAPYKSAVLNVPTSATSFLPVVEVQGAYSTQQYIDDSTKVNDIFDKIAPAFDPYKALLLARIGKPIRGLFPVLGDTITDSSPWDFWSKDTLVNKYGPNGLANNPKMSAVKARSYIDSMMVFFAPRACLALKLPCASVVTSAEDLIQDASVKLNVYPNPTTGDINFESDTYNPIKNIELFDIAGKSVRLVKNINLSNIKLTRNGLSKGVYIAKVQFAGGILSKKIMIED
jgi:Secretion system C-terminal sorting domain/Carboxylesterase family